MHIIKEYKLAGDFSIWLKFDDGFESEVNIKPLLGKGIASELLFLNAFRKVSIESGGGLVWENGFDICPNYLRELAEDKIRVS